MILRAGGRGQPLLALAAVFALWIGLRVALWESPLLGTAQTGGLSSPTGADTPAAASTAASAQSITAMPANQRTAIRAPASHPAALRMLLEVPTFGPLAARASPPSLQEEHPAFRLPQQFAREPVHDSPPEPSAMLRLAPLPPPSRWSGDAWLLYRPGSSGGLGAGPFVGRYGASQAGAVLRYRLEPDGHRLALYLRASTALASADDRQAAVGVAARPLSHVPVAVQAEMRVVASAARTEIVPAVLAVSELAPLTLPFDLRAEAYLAGGYVAGANRTAFVGGQLRVDRQVVNLGGVPVRLGAGAWGGAQRGARALDVGPSARAEIPLAGRRASLEAGYRWRIAGSAEPRSGPALTVSTGF